MALSCLAVEDFVELFGDLNRSFFGGKDLVDPVVWEVVAETRHFDGKLMIWDGKSVEIDSCLVDGLEGILENIYTCVILCDAYYMC